MSDQGLTGVRIRYFGPLLDVTGTPQETVSLRLPDTVAGVNRQLWQHRPGLAGVDYRLAVDETLREGEEAVATAREIALLPPFSGG